MRPLSKSSLALVLATCAVACSATENTAPHVAHVGDGAPVASVPTPPKTLPAKTPPVSPAVANAFSSSTDALAADLYARLAKAPGNFAFSPTSIQTALAMTYQGANGDTALQMQHAMHLGADPSLTLKGAASVLDGYAAPHADYEIAIADRLFGDKTYPFDNAFLASSQDLFGAPLEKVDFIHAFEPARRNVNGFVSGATKGHIADLLPEGSLNEDTRLVLVNAIYMHAAWLEGFPKTATAPAPFSTGATSHDVPMMHQTGDFGFADTPNAEVLDMPYKGGDLAMTVFLPKDAASMSAFEATLVPGEIEKLALATSQTSVDVSLPRFKASSDAPIRLKSHLSALGMPLAFDEQADFTKMGQPNAQRLHIDDAYHEAFVDVNEEGTTAAAATAVVMTREMAVVKPQPVEFRADHPFVYVIRDVHTNLVLFMGRVSDPSA